MKARISLLTALALAGAVCLAGGEAGAQPFGRAYGQRLAQFVQVRDEGRREQRGEARGREDRGREDRGREERGRDERGRGDQGNQGERGERGGYRGQPYAPAPRGYAYPAPAPGPRYQQAAPPRQAYAPPPAYAPRAYAQPRPYAYGPAPNSLGSGWRPQQEDARRGVRSGAMRPLGEVVANIQRTTRGRMLDAGVEPGPDGRPTYRVRWAAQGGRRIDFIVDAATGAIIGQSGY
jgi:hypothetical protein